jgi:hypothetical protein
MNTSELTLPSSWDQDSVILAITDEELSATSHEEACKVFEQWQSDEDDAARNVEGHEDIDADLDIMEVDEQIGSNLLGDDIFHDPCVSPTGPLEELVYMNLGEGAIDRFSLSLLSTEDAVTVGLGCSSALISSTSSLQDQDHEMEDHATSSSKNKKKKSGSLFDTKSNSRNTTDSSSININKNKGNGVLNSVNKNESDHAHPKTSSLPFEERYQATLQKLAESMKRSQETRKSLQMKTPKTEEYSRHSSVKCVLSSIEKSTQQLQNYLNHSSNIHIIQRV